MLDDLLTGAPGVVHVIGAGAALIAGPIVLFRKRKGDMAHRVLGLVFVAAMLAVNVTAFSMYEISGGWTLFHALAVASLAAVIPGFWTARLFALTRDRGYLVAHMTFMSWAYTGVVGAGVAQLATRTIPSLLGGAWLVGFLIAYFAASFALTGVLTVRYARRLSPSSDR